jgi:hypothetical protein
LFYYLIYQRTYNELQDYYLNLTGPTKKIFDGHISNYRKTTDKRDARNRLNYCDPSGTLFSIYSDFIYKILRFYQRSIPKISANNVQVAQPRHIVAVNNLTEETESLSEYIDSLTTSAKNLISNLKALSIDPFQQIDDFDKDLESAIGSYNKLIGLTNSNSTINDVKQSLIEQINITPTSSHHELLICALCKSFNINRDYHTINPPNYPYTGVRINNEDLIPYLDNILQILITNQVLHKSCDPESFRRLLKGEMSAHPIYISDVHGKLTQLKFVLLYLYDVIKYKQVCTFILNKVGEEVNLRQSSPNINRLKYVTDRVIVDQIENIISLK